MNGNRVTIDELLQIIADSSQISASNPIKREVYSTWLKKGLNNDLIKVISGFRRVGKSFLLKELAEYLVKKEHAPLENIFFVNFEHDMLAQRNTLENLREMVELHEQQIAQKGKIYLFLDEIQNVPGWEKFIRTLYDAHKKTYTFYVTGSNSALLSSEFSTALSGRTIETKISPFSFTEYIRFLGIHDVTPLGMARNKNVYMKHLLVYLAQGGFPEIIGQDKETVREYIQSLIRKVLLDDIVKRFDVQKISVLEKLLSYILSNIGTTTSFANISRALKKEGEAISVPTLQTYAHFYEQAFALEKIEKFDWKTQSVFRKQYKFYAVDNGLVQTLHVSKMGIDEKLLENLVYLILSGKHKKIYYGRDEDNKEIDFIIPQGEKAYQKVQVCLELNEENKKRELGNFVLADKYLRKGENILITLRGKKQEHVFGKGVIKEIPLLYFLVDF